MSPTTYDYRCIHCGTVVTSTQPPCTQGPDKRAGGACPRDSRGEHQWTPQR